MIELISYKREYLASSIEYATQQVKNVLIQGEYSRVLIAFCVRELVPIRYKDFHPICFYGHEIDLKSQRLITERACDYIYKR